MNDPFRYKTIKAASRGEFRDRGSKFLAFLFPVQSIAEVKKNLKTLKKTHPKAVHHCFAFRLGTSGNEFRASDDGEPPGSAGKPLLNQIDSVCLTDILVVVVRYFGGTLLGIPGLINAYKTAASLSLEHTEIIEKWIEERIQIQFEYPVMGEVMHLLKQSEASIYQQDLQLFCRITAGIPKHHAADYIKKLTEIKGVSIQINNQGS